MAATTAGYVARLRLLDGFEARLGGSVLDLKPSLQRLLAFLALANKSVERQHTAVQLWPDTPEVRALANLRSALWRLRQQPTDLVETTATHVRLHPDVWVDARHGVAELRTADADAVLAEGDERVSLAGDLLPGWYDEWLLIERERVRQLRAHSLEAACRRLLAANRWADAIELGLRVVAFEPLRESAHRLVIEAHLGHGNVSEALRQLESCRKLLRRELGVEPSAQLSRLLLTVRRHASRVGCETA
jgi:DNA-binding SARP family transcriptional activator